MIRDNRDNRIPRENELMKRSRERRKWNNSFPDIP